MHLSIEFSLAAALALILYFVAGKNNLALNVLLLLALFGFLLHPVLALPWVTNTQPLSLKVWKVAALSSGVFCLVSLFGLWIWPSAQTRAAGTDLPEIEFRNEEILILNFDSLTRVKAACFRNDSIRGGGREFWAQLIYRDVSGKEVADVSRGTWFPLNPSRPTITKFRTGEPRKLGLLFFQEISSSTSEVRLLQPLITWHSEQLIPGYTQPFPRVQEVELPRTATIIEVRFHTEGEQPKILKFRIDLKKGRPPNISPLS